MNFYCENIYITSCFVLVPTSIEPANFFFIWWTGNFYSIWRVLSLWVWQPLLPLFVFAGGSTLENGYLLAEICSPTSVFKHNLFFYLSVQWMCKHNCSLLSFTCARSMKRLRSCASLRREFEKNISIIIIIMLVVTDILIVIFFILFICLFMFCGGHTENLFCFHPVLHRGLRWQWHIVLYAIFYIFAFCKVNIWLQINNAVSNMTTVPWRRAACGQ